MLATRYPLLATSKPSDAQQQPRRILDCLLYFGEEGDRFATIHKPVVVAKCQIHHWPDDDLTIECDRPFVDRVQPEDGALWRIDDRRREHRSENPAVRNREHAA